MTAQLPWHHIYLNSLLPVSRYIDTAFADKGSHQKKNLQPKCPDTSKFGLLGKPTKKLELNPLFQSIFETSKFQKLKKSCFFLFWKNIFLTPPPLNCLYLRPSISDFTNFFFCWIRNGQLYHPKIISQNFHNKIFLKMNFL